MSNQKNILLDLDGTIIDPAEGIIESYSYALKKLGADEYVKDDMDWIIGPPLRISFAQIFKDKVTIEKAVEFYREAYSATGIYKARIYDGMLEAIVALKRNGHDIYLCTAKNQPFARRNLENFRLIGYFKEIYGAHLDGTYDDKAELIAHIISTHNLDNSATIMIGDREHDMIAAKKNNISAFGVLWGYGTEEELLKSGSDILLAQPRDILKELQ